jgi:hypothetical protein
MRALAERHAAAFDPLLGPDGAARREQFFDTATVALQRVIWPDRNGPGEGMSLYWLTEILGFLWKLALLEGLGFSPGEQQQLLARNRLYQHIAHKIASELFE